MRKLFRLKPYDGSDAHFPKEVSTRHCSISDISVECGYAAEIKLFRISGPPGTKRAGVSFERRHVADPGADSQVFESCEKGTRLAAYAPSSGKAPSFSSKHVERCLRLNPLIFSGSCDPGNYRLLRTPVSSSHPELDKTSAVVFLFHPTTRPTVSIHDICAGRRVGERVGQEKRPTRVPPPVTAAAARGAPSAAEAEAVEVERTHGPTEGVPKVSKGDTGAVEATAKQTRTTATGGVVNETVTVTEIGITAVPAPAATTASDRGAEKKSGAAAAAGRGATAGRPLPGPASRPSLHARAGRTKVVGGEKAEGHQPVRLPGETGSRQDTVARGPSSTRAKSPG